MALIKNKMIQDLAAGKVIESIDRRFSSDAEKIVWNAKASTDIVTTLVNGLMSKEDKIRLNGMEDGANLYVHPANHPATVITQTETHRMVSDVQIAAWDAKAEITTATQLANGLFSKEDKIRLDGMETGANKYIHPSTHNATMIDTTTELQFASQTEKDIWNGKQNAIPYTTENLANKGVANGYAGLDANGKVPLGQLPDASLEQTTIVADIAARDALIPTLKTADRVIVLAAEDGSRDGYLFDQTLNAGAGGFYKDSDTDWANVNIDWVNIINGPTATPAAIDAIAAVKAQFDLDTAKLATVATNAEVNQLAFSHISDGTTVIDATSKTDSVTFVAGDNIGITANAGAKTMTVAVTGKVPTAAQADSAAQATKLAANMTIALSGDVTGSVTTDGTGTATIVTTVVELNTHHHDINEVDGLETALGLKANLDVATTVSNGLMSASDKVKLNAAVNRYRRTILLGSTLTNGQTSIPTGIKTDGQGSYFTDVVEVSVILNGSVQVPGIGKDYTFAVNGSNEIVVTWLGRHFSLESDDEMMFEYNQLG